MASPNHSSTSLSDDEDEYNDLTPVEHRSTARWSTSRPSVLGIGSRHPESTSSEQSLLAPAARLPTEILIHALRQLTSPKDLYSCLLVSKMWCECSVELLWHKPIVTKMSSLFKMITIIGKEGESTFAYSSFIRRLNFVALANDMSDLLFSRIATCTRLERLTLVGCVALSDETIAKVLPCCPNLVALDLTSVVEVSDESILQLAASASRLQGINLGGCKKVTDVGIVTLARSCPLLRRIKLSGLTELTDESVCALASECPLLLEIDLNGCHRVSPRSVQDLWKMSKHMRELRLSHCLDLRDEAFPISPSIPDANLAAFSLQQSLPPLRLLSPFDHLRMLDLTCLPITDAAVEGIVHAAPKIRNLVLAKCSELTDKSVESICRLGKHLHYLHLGHASSITDSSVRLLALSCTRLRYIDLACCTLLTDLSVFELSNLPKLRRIGLVRVSNLTDDGVVSLVQRANTLERIHLSYCENITLRAVHNLLNRLGRLTHLSLTGIPAFRKPELQKFCRSPPREFNTAQRQAFCVYSGAGIGHLRNYLNVMMAKHTKADPNGYMAPYFQRLATGAISGITEPILLNGLDLDSGDDEEGTVVGDGSHIRGPRGRAGPNNGELGRGHLAPELPTFRPSSVPRDSSSGSRAHTHHHHHHHHHHNVDGRSSGLTTPGSGPELTRSISLEAEPSSSPAIGYNRRQAGKDREVPIASDSDSIPIASSSRSVGGRNTYGEEATRHIHQLPVPAFDEPVYSRHSRQRNRESDDDEEVNSNIAGSSSSRGLGVRRALKNTWSDAGALLFGRGTNGGSTGSGGTSVGRPGGSR